MTDVWLLLNRSLASPAERIKRHSCVTYRCFVSKMNSSHDASPDLFLSKLSSQPYSFHYLLIEPFNDSVLSAISSCGFNFNFNENIVFREKMQQTRILILVWKYDSQMYPCQLCKKQSFHSLTTITAHGQKMPSRNPVGDGELPDIYQLFCLIPTISFFIKTRKREEKQTVYAWLLQPVLSSYNLKQLEMIYFGSAIL